MPANKTLVPSLAALLALTACPSPPETPGLLIEPESPHTTDELSLTITDSPELDEDDVVTYEVDWFRDDQPVAELEDSLVVAADLTAKNEVWRVVVTPVDDKERVGEAIEAEVTILNTAPVVEVSLAPAGPETTDALLATATSSDVDGDTLTTTYTWLRDGAATADTGDTLAASETAKGQTWTVQAVVNDGEVDSLVAEASVTIGNATPIADSVSLTPDPPTEADTLLATPAGSDVDSDTLTWSYAWSVDGTGVSATGDSLTGADFSKGQVVVVAATPSDGSDAGNTVTASVTVANTPPTLESATIDPGEAREADTLTCLASGWADIDGDAEAYRTSWSVAGADLGESETLGGDEFAKGDAVTCTLVPWDGEEDGAPVTSEAITILNTPPTITGVSLDSTSPKTNDTLTATVRGGADADGDALTYTYEWSVDSAVVVTDISSDTTSTLSGVDWFDKGETVWVTVTPGDDEDDGVAATSATATVGNTAPTDPSVSLSPSSPATSDDLVCSLGTASTDADGDSLTYAFSWLRNGSAWTGRTSTTTRSGDTILAAETSAGETWQCQARAFDGTDYSGTASSTTVTVESAVTPPSVGTTGTYGVISGDAWKVCRADTSTAWVAANTTGTYDAESICQAWGYSGVNAKGGTCGVVCGYCGTPGREYYDGGGGSTTSLRYTVHWRCVQ